jgi:hypothetical protein
MVKKMNLTKTKCMTPRNKMGGDKKAGTKDYIKHNTNSIS